MMMKNRRNFWPAIIVFLFPLSLFVSAHAKAPSCYESNKFDEISVGEGKEPFILKGLFGANISPGEVMSLEEVVAIIGRSQEKNPKKIISSVRFLCENNRYFKVVYFHENKPDVFYKTVLLFAVRASDNTFHLFPEDNGQAFELSIPASRMNDTVVRLLAPRA